MGNQQANCCNQSQDRLQYIEAHNSINPIKYGSKIRNYEKFKGKTLKPNQQSSIRQNNKKVFQGLNQNQLNKQVQSNININWNQQPNLTKSKKFPSNVKINVEQSNYTAKQSSLMKSKKFPSNVDVNVEQSNQAAKQPQPQPQPLPLSQNNGFRYQQFQIPQTHSVIQQISNSEQQNHSNVSNSTKKRKLQQQHQRHSSSNLSNSSKQQQQNAINLNHSSPGQQNVMLKSKQGYQSQSMAMNSNTLVNDPSLQLEYLPIPFQQSYDEVSKSPNIIRARQQRDVFQGHIDSKNQKQGLGILVKQNGSVLIANYENNEIYGKVFFAFNNGSFYQGLMRDSKANDLQGQFHSVKLSYKGQFKDSQFSGNGEQIGDDHYFKGQYENGLKKKGTLKWEVKLTKRGQQMHESTLNKAQSSLKPQQQSNYQFGKSTVRNQAPPMSLNTGTEYNSFNKPNNNNEQEQDILPPKRDLKRIPKYKWSYNGSFDQNQKFTGYGTLEQYSKGVYKGQFLDGLKHGKGVFQYTNKLLFQGSYVKGSKQGFGVLKNYDGTIAYEGQWRENMPNGKGYIYDSNGQKRQSDFINGISIELIENNHRSNLH